MTKQPKFPMKRSEAWAYYSTQPLRVSECVFIDIFKTIYDAVELEPNSSLARQAPSILKQLEQRRS